MRRNKGWLFVSVVPLIMILLFSPYLKAADEIPIIEDIKIDIIKESPEIKVASNVAIEYLDYTLQDPPRIIIDPLGTVYCNLDEKVFSGENLVKAVSIIKTRADIPKELESTYYPLDFIVIELKKPHYYNIAREEKLVVQLGEEMLPLSETKIIEKAIESREIEIAEAPEPKAEISRDIVEEEIQSPVGKEFFDEEKFPLIERYKIEPGDELEISVWQHPDLLRKVVVRPDGFISFPLAGEIKATGLTTERLSREIVLRLSRVLRKPEVSVIAAGFGSKGIFVLGAVNKPGLYPYKTKMTALGAVSLAEGWQTQAWLKSILVVKKFFKEDAEVVRVNLWDVIKKGDVKKDIELQAGDIVYVPQSFIGNLGTFLDGLRVRFGTGAYFTISN